MGYVIRRAIPCILLFTVAWFFYGLNYFSIHGEWSIWTEESANIISFEAREDAIGYTDAAMTQKAAESATITRNTPFDIEDCVVINGDTLQIGGVYYRSSSFGVSEQTSTKTPFQRVLMLIPLSLQSGWQAILDTITGKMSITRFMEPIAIPSNPFVWLFNIPLIAAVIVYYKGYIARPWRYLGNSFTCPGRLFVFPVLLLFSLCAASACFFSKNNFSQGFAVGDLQAVLAAGFAIMPPGEVVEGLTAPHWIAVAMYWVCKLLFVAVILDILRVFSKTKRLASTACFAVFYLGFFGLFIFAAIAMANAVALVVYIIAVILALLYFFGQVGNIVTAPTVTVYKMETETTYHNAPMRSMDD